MQTILQSHSPSVVAPSPRTKMSPWPKIQPFHFRGGGGHKLVKSNLPSKIFSNPGYIAQLKLPQLKMSPCPKIQLFHFWSRGWGVQCSEPKCHLDPKLNFFIPGGGEGVHCPEQKCHLDPKSNQNSIWTWKPEVLIYCIWQTSNVGRG